MLGYRNEMEHLTALNEADGKLLWSAEVGPSAKEITGMRWLCQRTPTVDKDRVYAFTALGELACFGTADGKRQWHKDYVKDFGGKPWPWGYCDFPLIDGDRLICTPGAKGAGIVALDKKTGETIWKCAVPMNLVGTYGGIVAAEIAGTRQYLHQLEKTVVGVRAKDGALLWDYRNFGDGRGNVHTAIVRGDEVFASNGWGHGIALLRIKRDGEQFTVEEVYRIKNMPLDPWLGSSVRIGDYVHASNGICMEWKTGNRIKQPEAVVLTNRGTMTAAGDRLIHRSGNGVVTLTEVSPEGTYKRRGELKIPPAAKEPTWTTPVVANGRLYLRDQGILTCHDLREPEEKKRDKKPAVIFVPTPHDVVERMLEAAKVTKGDIVTDLGCGDGRIVIAAAKTYGSKATGFDLDPECVKRSRDAVEMAGVGKLVTIEEADMLDVDLSKFTVVTLFVGTTLNGKLVPQFEKMKAGSRVVSHQFPIPGVKADRVLKVTSKEDDIERPIYLYTLPLTKEKQER